MKLSYRDLCRAWGIDEQEHRLLFEWLMQDPRDEQGRLTREIGLTKLGGTPEKLQRVHTPADLAHGNIFYRQDGTPFPARNGQAVSVSKMDFNFNIPREFESEKKQRRGVER
ncbi:MAG: hypothetical protein KGZ53_10745 [Peptococcaceae bacterium]|nr:hypothetical protein [Peptococcaceae bacterium]